MPSIRLLPEQVTQLIRALTPSVSELSATLYLYGSRTDPARFGGDIDLLLVVGSKTQREQLMYKKHYLLEDINRALGDQKIDLTIATKDSLKKDTFLSFIAEDAVLLHQW